jgi:hypothetical protein
VKPWIPLPVLQKKKKKKKLGKYGLGCGSSGKATAQEEQIQYQSSSVFLLDRIVRAHPQFYLLGGKRGEESLNPGSLGSRG